MKIITFTTVCVIVTLGLQASAAPLGSDLTWHELEEMLTEYDAVIRTRSMSQDDYAEWLERFAAPVKGALALSANTKEKQDLLHRARFTQMTLANVTGDWSLSREIATEFLASAQSKDEIIHWSFSLGKIEWHRFVVEREKAFAQSAVQALSAGFEELKSRDNWEQKDLGLLLQAVEVSIICAQLLHEEFEKSQDALTVLEEATELYAVLHELSVSYNPRPGQGFPESLLAFQMRISASIGKIEDAETSLEGLSELPVRRQHIGYYVLEMVELESPDGGLALRERIMGWVDRIEDVNVKCNMLFRVARSYSKTEDMQLLEHLASIQQQCVDTDMLPVEFTRTYDRESSWLAMMAHRRLGDTSQAESLATRFAELAQPDDVRLKIIDRTRSPQRR